MRKISQKMPSGVWSLFTIHAFSTFTFAVLYSSLSLYTTKQLELSNTVSIGIVGLFLALNYALHLLGGIIGGTYLSNRSLFLITTLIQTFGVWLLTFAETQWLYLGLSSFLVGCGLNATCFNNMLTQRFDVQDIRREQAFFYNYSAMNIGFCAGFFLSGFYDYSSQYQGLFYMSLACNVITLLMMIYAWPALNDRRTSLADEPNQTKRAVKQIFGIAFTIFLAPLLMLGFKSTQISNGLIVAASLLMFAVIFNLGLKQDTKSEQQKIMAYLILAITSIVFWMIYYTGPMGVTLFVKNNVDKQLLNYPVATQWILNINSIVVIIGAPVIAGILKNLQAKGIKTPITTQFACAFILLALSFYLLSVGIKLADANGYSNIWWTILHFMTQAIAELCIAPVGYAMIGRIAPAHLQGLLMGTWMMVSGVASSLSHYFSNAMVKTQATNPLMTNEDYLRVFNQLGLWALVGAVFLFLIAQKILLTAADDAKAGQNTLGAKI